jgi:hypothetical protein
MEPDTTPYEQIDCEIRLLVRLINRFPGIRSEYSCAGHKEGDEGYVTFSAESQEALSGLVTALPPLTWSGGLLANRFQWRSITLNVTIAPDGRLRYNLRFAGDPQYVQRRLIGEMEATLAAALEQRRPPLKR